MLIYANRYHPFLSIKKENLQQSFANFPNSVENLSKPFNSQVEIFNQRIPKYAFQTLVNSEAMFFCLQTFHRQSQTKKIKIDKLLLPITIDDQCIELMNWNRICQELYPNLTSELTRRKRAELITKLKERQEENSPIVLALLTHKEIDESIEENKKDQRLIINLDKIYSGLSQGNQKASGFMISYLPVIPPDLRPIIPLDINVLAISDLNELYKRIIARNKRIINYWNTWSKNPVSPTVDNIVSRYFYLLIYQSVSSLLDNGKGKSKVAYSLNERPLKSLSEILKGKKGRFRGNLLGKRVDYSGRAVIMVGPKLKLHECGLPIDMAIELFQTFLIRDLIGYSRLKRNHQLTIMRIKNRFIKPRHPVIWDVLQSTLNSHPILLNRAPTLHRLGIQAFMPKLVKEKAIVLHPLVCSAFNADFDGDQMAVHVPLTVQTIVESMCVLWSIQNLVSPNTGEPSIVPSQDMVIGCYYLTTFNPKIEMLDKSVYFYSKFAKKKTQLLKKNIFQKHSLKYQKYTNLVNNILLLNKYFINFDDVLIALSQKQLTIHSSVWLKWENLLENENFDEKPLEMRIDIYGNICKIYSKYIENKNNKNQKISMFVLTTVGRIILHSTIIENIKKLHLMQTNINNFY